MHVSGLDSLGLAKLAKLVPPFDKNIAPPIQNAPPIVSLVNLILSGLLICENFESVE